MSSDIGIDHKTTLDPDVAAAFGVSPDISLMPGGVDLKTFRSGNIVLRNLGTHSQEAGVWNAELFSNVKEKGFRVAKPIKAHDGSWIVNGWIAEEFLKGSHATKDDLPVVINAITQFHKALIGITLPDYRRKELTIWDRADQMAWGEIPKDIDPQLYKLAIELDVLRKPVAVSNQLIHGDLNLNNILIADNVPPAIIDLAPYWRPAEFALAVMAYWVGPYEGDIRILDKFKQVEEFDQMLIRAGLRMMLTQKDLRHATDLQAYRKANEVIKQYVSSNSAEDRT